MGNLSQHWSFWERVKWMWSGTPPNRDVIRAELERLRYERVERHLEMIDLQHAQAARKEKIDFLKDGAQ